MKEFIDYYKDYIRFLILKYPGSMLVCNALIHVWLGYFMVYLLWSYAVSGFIMATLVITGLSLTCYCVLSDSEENRKWKEREAKKLCEKFGIEYVATNFFSDKDIASMNLSNKVK